MSTFFSLCALSEGASRGRVPPKSGYKDRDGDRDRGREIKRETEKRQKIENPTQKKTRKTVPLATGKSISRTDKKRKISYLVLDSVNVFYHDFRYTGN